MPTVGGCPRKNRCCRSATPRRKSNGARPSRPSMPRISSRRCARAQGVCATAGVKAGPLLEACTLDVAVIGLDAAAKVFVDAIPPAAVGTAPAGGGILEHLKHWWIFLPFTVILIAAWFFMRSQL